MPPTNPANDPTRGRSPFGSIGAASAVTNKPGSRGRSAISFGGPPSLNPPAPAAPTAPKAPAPAASPWPTGPAAGPTFDWQYEKPTDPEMARSRVRAESYLDDLKKNTGFAMDVQQGAQQAQIDADIERARESAAAQGIPFDEAAYRAKANQQMQASIAQQTLGREQMYGQMQAGLQGNIAGEGGRALEKSQLALGAKSAQAGAENTRYGTQAGIYATNVAQQTQMYQIAMDMLRSFLNMSFSV